MMTTPSIIVAFLVCSAVWRFANALVVFLLLKFMPPGHLTVKGELMGGVGDLILALITFCLFNIRLDIHWP